MTKGLKLSGDRWPEHENLWQCFVGYSFRDADNAVLAQNVMITFMTDWVDLRLRASKCPETIDNKPFLDESSTLLSKEIMLNTIWARKLRRPRLNVRMLTNNSKVKKGFEVFCHWSRHTINCIQYTRFYLQNPYTAYRRLYMYMYLK